jgi:hypothetical protein
MSEQNLLVSAGSVPAGNVPAGNVPAPNTLRCALQAALASARLRYSAHPTAPQTKIPKSHHPSTFAA